MKTYLNIFICLYSLLVFSNTETSNFEISQNEMSYTIPVLFHIVLKNKQQQDSVSKNKVQLLINLLNDDFNARNAGLETIHNSFKGNIANCKINFVFASSIYPNNLFDDITYHYSSKKNYSSKFIVNPNDDIDLKRYGYQDSKKFLNVWITDISEPNIFGYATPKSMVGEFRDGVVIDYKIIDESYSLTHEIGHYLGLKHLWGGVCGVLLNTIGICSGDGIKDTPRQKGPSDLADCDLRRSCEYGKYVNNQNFMDYGYCVGMFTNGQKEKMRSNLCDERKGLLLNQNCKPLNEEIIVAVSNTFTDSRDNQTYKYVNVGNKRWMTDNLKYSTPESVCYDEKEYNCSIYGRLYNWHEAMNACPDGWRLPKTEDWKEMAEYVKYNLKTIKSTQGWARDNGTNDRQLNMLPSGYYTVIKTYRGLGQRASFWLADDSSNNTNRNSRTIRDGFNQIPLSGIHFAREKLSCRCIQDY